MRIDLTSVFVDDQERAARSFVSAIVRDGIPSTSFAVEDVAVFDDTCGNLIQITQEVHEP